VVHAGPSGGGTYAADTGLPWWTQTSTGSSAIPASVPAAVSTNVASPTVLGNAQAASYAVNSATAGHNAVIWVFSEATTASASTEVELALTARVASVTSTITVYIETQSTPQKSPVAITFYFDAGTGVMILNSWSQVTQPCTSVGTCP
jgi:hypothetical protein